MDQPIVLTWHWKLQHKLFVKITPALGGTVRWNGIQAPECTDDTYKSFTVRNWYDVGQTVDLEARPGQAEPRFRGVGRQPGRLRRRQGHREDGRPAMGDTPVPARQERREGLEAIRINRLMEP